MLRSTLLLIIVCIVWKRNTHGYLLKRKGDSSRGPRLRLIESTNAVIDVQRILELTVPAFASIIVPVAFITSLNSAVDKRIQADAETLSAKVAGVEKLLMAEKESRQEQSANVEKRLMAEKESRQEQSANVEKLLMAEKESRKEILKAFEDKLVQAISRFEATSRNRRGGSD
jgi:hypothetical protein